MLALEHPDRIHVAFDDHRLVANAGLLLPATLALRLGFGELAEVGSVVGRQHPEADVLVETLRTNTSTWGMPRAGPTLATS